MQYDSCKVIDFTTPHVTMTSYEATNSMEIKPIAQGPYTVRPEYPRQWVGPY